MAAQKGQPDNTSDHNYAIIGLAVFMALVISWFLFGQRFVAMMGMLRHLELKLFAPFFDGAADLELKLDAVKGEKLEFRESVAMLSKTGAYVRWLYVLPMVAMAVRLYMKSFRGRFRRVHTMSSLATQEAVLWPEIAPVAGKQVEMVKGDITKGPWAVAMTEWEFAERYKLATRGGALNRDLARDVFVTQLGPLWTGASNLPLHTRALYAAFILRIAGKNADSLKAFRAMSKSFADGGVKTLDTAFVDAAIAEHSKHPLVVKAHAQHAYVFTLMATLQQIARSDGILASSMYTWLKTVDRRLFYTLNNVGRYAFHVECAGIMAHWLFEKTCGAACPTPLVEKAIDGLDLALGEYCEDDTLERIYK